MKGASPYTHHFCAFPMYDFDHRLLGHGRTESTLTMGGIRHR